MTPVRVARAVVCLAMLSSAAPVAAQRGQDGALVGTVVDASGAALVGATVMATSPQQIGGPRTASTDAAGRYRFPVLDAGEYALDVSLSGFKPARLEAVLVPPGLAITVDVPLALDSVSETLAVTTRPAVIDVHSTASPAAIERVLIDTLPLSRDVHTYVNLAPGVTDNVAFGGSARVNPLTVDGASGNEPGWGSASAPFARTWLDEVQIIGPGAEAQHGEFTGVTMNAVTRSGANRFSGLGEYRTTRQSWTGDNRGSLPLNLAASFRPLEVVTRWEGIGQVGGPALRDRLWFFTGGQRYRDDTRSAAFGDGPRAPDEPIPSFRTERGIAKLTAALPRSPRLEGFLARNVNRARRTDAGPLVRPEATGHNDRTDDLWNVRLSWASGLRWLFDARHGGNRRDGSSGAPPDRRDGPPSHYDLVTDVYSVNTGFADSWDSRVHTTSAALTGYLDGLGHHELKLGGEFEHAAVVDTRSYPGGRLFLDYDGQPYQVLLWDGSTYRGRHRRLTAFAQDAWSLDPITVQAGLRVESYRAGAPYNAPYRTHSVAPRLGIAWDVGRRHHTVVRAHYGRYHDPIVSSYYDFLDPLSQKPEITAEVVGPDQFVELYRFLPFTSLALDPEIKSSYVREWLAGVEHALPGRVSLKAQVVQRDFKNTASFVDTATIWAPIIAQDPGPDGREGTADDGGQLTIYNNTNPGAAQKVLTNPPQAYRRYRAVQVVASRRASRGPTFQASYTWSRTVGNFNNAFSSNAANNDNSVNGVFVNPNRAINRDGPTGFDYTHAFKAFGTWMLPFGWTVSGVYRYESGKPWARSATFTRGLNQGFENVLIEPFVRRAPALNSADLRLEKTVRIAAATAGLYADVFNVINAGRARTFVTQSGPRFGQPAGWMDPRTITLGARLQF